MINLPSSSKHQLEEPEISSLQKIKPRRLIEMIAENRIEIRYHNDNQIFLSINVISFKIVDTEKNKSFFAKNPSNHSVEKG